MAWQYLDPVFNARSLTPFDKLILLRIAHAAYFQQKDCASADVGLRRIARDTGMSREGVRNVIDRLIASGILTVTAESKGTRSRTLKLNLGRLAANRVGHSSGQSDWPLADALVANSDALAANPVPVSGQVEPASGQLAPASGQPGWPKQEETEETEIPGRNSGASAPRGAGAPPVFAEVREIQNPETAEATQQGEAMYPRHEGEHSLSDDEILRRRREEWKHKSATNPINLTNLRAEAERIAEAERKRKSGRNDER